MFFIMQDQFNRTINYIRISLTDRCNLHCSYCQPELAEFVPHGEILRYEELLRLCRIAVELGITRFKLTGGEPLLRKGALDFIRSLKQLEGVEQVTLTSNGILLKDAAHSLASIGIDAVNISLDTLNPQKYHDITGGNLDDALAGVQAALKAGLKVKLNCVPLKNYMKIDDILALMAYADTWGLTLRFIELMPLSCNTALVGYTGDEVRQMLEQLGMELVREKGSYGNGPAVYYRNNVFKVPVGFIEPLHHKFCGLCNRVRLTSVGFLKPCLYSDVGCDVKALLRQGATDAELKEAMQQAIYAKPREHDFNHRAAAFAMSRIGG